MGTYLDYTDLISGVWIRVICPEHVVWSESGVSENPMVGKKNMSTGHKIGCKSHTYRPTHIHFSLDKCLCLMVKIPRMMVRSCLHDA
jgi:hypothetical protein